MSLMKQLKEKTGYYYGVNDKSGKYELEFALKLLGVRVGRIQKIFAELIEQERDEACIECLRNMEKGVLAELTADE